MRFGKSDKIQFISTVEGLESVEECLPRPAKHFIPQWFKDVPSKSLNTVNLKTVKVCPSFPDYFSQGYIVPMWSDVKIASNGDSWKWSTPNSSFSWSDHANNQFLDYTKATFNGVESQYVFKANCPWRIITPPGWSVLQLPLFYHFNQEWSVLPGVIDTDIHHEINQQVLYHANGKDITINSGDPFVLYVPYKRSNNLKHEVFYQTPKIKKYFNKGDFRISRAFSPNGIYRDL